MADDLDMLLEPGRFCDNVSLRLALVICFIIQKEDRDVKSLKVKRKGSKSVFGRSVTHGQTYVIDGKKRGIIISPNHRRLEVYAPKILSANPRFPLIQCLRALIECLPVLT